MKAYYGVHLATGRYVAWSRCPDAVTWGKTAEEVKRQLADHLQQRYGLTVVWNRPWEIPDAEIRQQRSGISNEI